MATLDVPIPSGASNLGQLDILRSAATGAAVLVIIYAVCWVGAAINLGPVSHMYMALFTNAPMASASALGVGLCWSLAFGALIGGLIPILYRAFAFLARR